MIDLDAIRAVAMAATAGGRTMEPHPFRPKTEAVLLDDNGDGLAEGNTAEIAFAVAASPAVVLEMVHEIQRLRSALAGVP